MFAGGGPGTSCLPSPRPTRAQGAQATRLCRKIGAAPPCGLTRRLKGRAGPQVPGPPQKRLIHHREAGEEGPTPSLPRFFFGDRRQPCRPQDLKKIIKNFSDVNKQPIWIVKHKRGKRWKKNYRVPLSYPVGALNCMGDSNSLPRTSTTGTLEFATIWSAVWSVMYPSPWPWVTRQITSIK